MGLLCEIFFKNNHKEEYKEIEDFCLNILDKIYYQSKN